jgi:hypothetical protein
MRNGNNADKAFSCRQHMIFWDTFRLMCGVLGGGVGGGAVADADADVVIVSFTLQIIIIEDLIAHALSTSISPLSPPPRPCSLCPTGAVPLVSCLAKLCENARASRPPSAALSVSLISLVHMPALLACPAVACWLAPARDCNYHWYCPPKGLPTLSSFSLKKAPSSTTPNLIAAIRLIRLSHHHLPLPLYPASSPPLPSHSVTTQISTSCAAHSISRPPTFASILPFSAAHPPAERHLLDALQERATDLRQPCWNLNITLRALPHSRKRRFPSHGPQYPIPFLAGIAAGYVQSSGQPNPRRRQSPLSKPPSTLPTRYARCGHIGGRIMTGNT